jgi:hypothetical protein
VRSYDFREAYGLGRTCVRHSSKSLGIPDMRVAPPELLAALDRLTTEVVLLFVRAHLFRQLYAKSPRRVELLNAAAPDLFYYLQHILADDIRLAVARLTDSASMGRFENLTLPQLVKLSAYDPSLPPRLDAILSEILSQSLDYREFRNKEIAHLDLSRSGRGAEHRGNLNLGELELLLVRISDFMQVLHVAVQQTTVAYDIVSLAGDGDALAEHLRASLAFRAFRRFGAEAAAQTHEQWRDA